jgi:hypothetical protein
MIFIEARAKDTGVESSAIAEVITGIPKTAFDSILWCGSAPTWDEFVADIQQLAYDLLASDKNSLFRIISSANL